ncbi:MFS domain-containing protein [Lachancea thermotolerans]
MYSDGYRNTFVVDVLGYFRLVKGVEKDLESGSAVLVDWNGPEGPETPYNWSEFKKEPVAVQIMIFTCVAYMGASIYTPTQKRIQ